MAELPEDQFKAKNVWVIKYEDADIGDDVFVGEEAEECAKFTYEKKVVSWNCYLLAPAERITTLEAENEALRDHVARLRAPVSDEEARENGHHDDWGVPCWYRTEIDTLLAARAAQPPADKTGA